MVKKLLIHNLSESLDGATTATIDINAGTGNLTVDQLSSGAQLLAAGTLEYLEDQDRPTPSVSRGNGHARLTLKASGSRRSSLRMPCRGR